MRASEHARELARMADAQAAAEAMTGDETRARSWRTLAEAVRDLAEDVEMIEARADTRQATMALLGGNVVRFERRART